MPGESLQACRCTRQHMPSARRMALRRSPRRHCSRGKRQIDPVVPGSAFWVLGSCSLFGVRFLVPGSAFGSRFRFLVRRLVPGFQFQFGVRDAEPVMTFSTAVYIEAPPALVFDALSNLEEAKEWMPNFVSIEMLTPGPVGAGTEWLQTRKTFGKHSTEHFRVTRWHPPSRLDIRGDGMRGTT